MESVSVNYLAVIVAAIINMVVGAVWYSPMLFAGPWSKLVGRKMEDLQKNATKGYVISAIGALVQAFLLVHFVRYADATTVLKGAEVGAGLWLGFVATTTAMNSTFAGRPWKLWKIDAGYFLVVLIINGALLACWR